MLTDTIRLAVVKKHNGDYVDVTLREEFDESSDGDPIEAMPLRGNSKSKVLPEVDTDVIVVFDHVGDCYLLGAMGSENQTLPSNDEPGTLNAGNQELTLKATEDGKIEVSKTSPNPLFGFIEIIDLLVTALNDIGTSTCPPNGVLSNSVAILLAKDKLNEFKV